jgi:cytochrome c biogenesis protein CcdA
MSILFLYALQFFNLFSGFKYVFAGILIFIGIWQILESKKDESTIFKTPAKVKLVLKDFIDRNSGFYAFLVGIIFILIKIPCFGGAYLALLCEFQTNPLFLAYIITYFIGMIIPIVLVLVLLRLGLESSKINEFRLKHRTSLRILNGVILIFLALFLLFLYDLIESLIV